MRYILNTYRVADADGHRYQFSLCEDSCLDRIGYEVFKAVLAWAVEHFGPGAPAQHAGEQIGCRWCYSPSSFSVWLRDPNDVLAFKMRWC